MKKQRLLAILLTAMMIIGLIPAVAAPVTVLAADAEKLTVTYSFTKAGRPDVKTSSDTLEILTRSGDSASWETNTYTSVWNPEYKVYPSAPTDAGQNWAYLGTNARFCGGRFGSVTTTNMTAAWLYCDPYIMHTSPHTMGVEYVDGEEWIAFRVKAPATATYTVKEMTGCTFANGSKQIDVYVLPYEEEEKAIFSEGNTDTYGTSIVPYALSGSLLYAERIGAKAFSSLGISSDYKVASANYYAKTTNANASAPISGATEFALEAGSEYIVLFNAKQTGVMHIANLTLEYVKPEMLNVTYSFTKAGRPDVKTSSDTLEILTRSGDPASWETNTYTSVWNPEYKVYPSAPTDAGQNWAYLGTNARFCGGRFGSVTTTNMTAAWLYCDPYITHTSPHTMGVEYVDGEEWIAFRVKAPATSTYTVKEMTGCTFANGSKQIDVYVLPYEEEEKAIFSEGNTDTYGTGIVPYALSGSLLYAERIGAKAFSSLGIASDYKVASANYYAKTTNANASAPISGATDFALKKGSEYVIIFNAKQTGVMHIANLTLEYVKPEMLNATYSFTKAGRPDVKTSSDTLEILTRSGDPASWETNTYTSVWNPEYKVYPSAPTDAGQNWAYLGTNARFCGGRFGSIPTTNMTAAWLYCDPYILHTSPHTMGVEYVNGEEWIAFRVKAPATATYTVKEMTGCAFANGSKQIDVYVFPYGESEKAIFSEGNTDTYGTGIVPYALSGSLLYAERIGGKPFSSLGIASDYKVASANYYAKTTNANASAPISGATDFALEAGKEYVVLFNAKQTGVMHIANLTLEYEKPSELTRIEADFGKVAVGSKLSPKVTWYSGSKKIDGEAGSVAMEIVEDSDNILLKTSGGDIIAVADGTAKIKVTGTLNGKSRSVEVTLVITHPNARVEEATTAKVYITATSGAVLENVSGAVVGSQIDAAVNTTVSVTAPKTTPDGKVFKYWKNLSSDSVYSTSENISFKVASNISLMAVYAEKENGYLVEFANANRNIVSSKYLNSGDAIIAPALPYLTGYGVATSWSSYPEIVGTSDVQSIAEYGAPESVAVTVIGGTSDKTEYSYNDKVTVTANAAPSGKVFSHWTRDGQVVSYNSVYSFYAWDDATITANYAASAPSAFPSVIIDASVRNDGGANAYMMELVGFEGKQILERGILFGGSGLSLSGGTVYKAVSVLGATQFSAMTPDTSFDVSAVRAYVVYNDNGIIRIAYSAER